MMMTMMIMMKVNQFRFIHRLNFWLFIAFLFDISEEEEEEEEGDEDEDEESESDDNEARPAGKQQQRSVANKKKGPTGAGGANAQNTPAECKQQ